MIFKAVVSGHFSWPPGISYPQPRDQALLPVHTGTQITVGTTMWSDGSDTPGGSWSYHFLITSTNEELTPSKTAYPSPG